MTAPTPAESRLAAPWLVDLAAPLSPRARALLCAGARAVPPAEAAAAAEIAAKIDADNALAREGHPASVPMVRRIAECTYGLPFADAYRHARAVSARVLANIFLRADRAERRAPGAGPDTVHALIAHIVLSKSAAVLGAPLFVEPVVARAFVLVGTVMSISDLARAVIREPRFATFIAACVVPGAPIFGAARPAAPVPAVPAQ